MFIFFFQGEDGIRDSSVTGVQTCALPISSTAVYGGLSEHREAALPPNRDRNGPVSGKGHDGERWRLLHRARCAAGWRGRRRLPVDSWRDIISPGREGGGALPQRLWIDAGAEAECPGCLPSA